MRITLLLFIASACTAPTLVPPTVDQDPTLPSIELNGSRFFLSREGASDGTPIVFLAGGPGNDVGYLRRLSTTCEGGSLGARHPLAFWDQRGAGLSRRHDDPALLTAGVFRADLEALVDALDPARRGVVLVGHSWGGTLAARFAEHHPERIRGLVLLEPGELDPALADDRPVTSTLDARDEWINDFAWSQELLSLDDHERLDFSALQAVRRAQPGRINREEPDLVRLGAAVVRSNALGQFDATDSDDPAALSQLELEVLLIAGDTPTSDLGAAFQRRQATLFQRPTLEVIDGAGHADVVWADGCKTAAFIEAYLARLEQRR